MTQGKDERAVTRFAGDADGAGLRPANDTVPLAAPTLAAPLPDGAPARVAPGRRAISDADRTRIGRGLRLHYADVLALPIPERLRTLIDDLAACSDTEAPQ
ncbi:NepR family anti-sigma factor [Methylobacterium sp. E-066]|uniref:NepR family anti-sigma factor n=1 Tax=Methylobacterium sp. E-066 TaxID=2836584 RepID=UPI001FBA2952|nr:NepR family anti-sigma factor [Methylobacterium sp. E-066]MCJ2142381.1 hypothetical protein [Methylobacterium sp. E-066]